MTGHITLDCSRFGGPFKQGSVVLFGPWIAMLTFVSRIFSRAKLFAVTGCDTFVRPVFMKIAVSEMSESIKVILLTFNPWVR